MQKLPLLFFITLHLLYELRVSGIRQTNSYSQSATPKNLYLPSIFSNRFTANYLHNMAALDTD